MGYVGRRESSQAVANPSWRTPSTRQEYDEAFIIKIKNYLDLCDAFSFDLANDAIGYFISKLQHIVGDLGVISRSDEISSEVIVLCSSECSSRLFGRRASDWIEALATSMILKPFFTINGPLHLKTVIKKLERLEECWCSLGETVGVEELKDTNHEVRQRSYRSDMAVVSPVLQGMRLHCKSGSSHPSGNVADIEVSWRSIKSLRADCMAALHEASLTSLKPNGQYSSTRPALAAAERIGLVHLIDQFLVSRAVDELIEARGAISLLVAVSPATLVEGRFWDQALERLKTSGLSNNLVVEVRRSVCSLPMQDIGRTLATLKRGGCRISFGNFGFGSTSLGDLLAFAPDFVTVDKHFLSLAFRDQYGAAPLAHIVGLGRTTGAEVIVDGVDCVEAATVAHQSGAAFQKGSWCGNRRFSRSWVKAAAK